MLERNTIVVGYDGSENARSAVEAAADLVAPEGVVHVVTAYRIPTANDVERLWRELPEEFRAGFDPLAGPASDRDEAVSVLEQRGVRCEGHLRDGDPAGAILDFADEVDADLIVVGSRGLGRATRFVRGSVSSKVAGHATTSFLVIHDD